MAYMVGAEGNILAGWDGIGLHIWMVLAWQRVAFKAAY